MPGVRARAISMSARSCCPSARADDCRPAFEGPAGLHVTARDQQGESLDTQEHGNQRGGM